MRRPSPRLAIAPVLAVMLMLSTAPGAFATRAPQAPLIPERIERLLPSPLRVVASELLGARRIRRVRGFTGTFRVAGSAYRWQFAVVRADDHFTLFLTGDQFLSDGYQSHSWRFRLPLGLASIGAHLGSAHVHTGSALGSFGALDLKLGALEPTRTHAFRCPKNHDVLFRTFTRKGTLDGSFDFTPNEGTLPDLHATSMHAIAFSYTFTGRRCRTSYRPGLHCARPSSVGAADASLSASLAGYVNDYSLQAHQVEHIALATVEHSFGVISHAGPPITVTPTGLSIDASTLGPFASGTLAFTTGTRTTRTGAHCVLVKIAQDWSSGTLSVNFDSGAVDFTGAGLEASVHRSHKP